MNLKITKIIIAGGVVLSLWGAHCFACPPDKPCPPPLNPPTPTPTPPPAHDPVFVVSPSIFASDAVKGAKNASDEGAAVLGADERKIAKALENCKDGMVAKKIAWEAWKSEVSAQLQRHVLMMARSMAGTTDDKQAMDFMLESLENPSVAQEKCFAEARGNGLEKKKAADQLAILLQNPNLKERLK